MTVVMHDQEKNEVDNCVQKLSPVGVTADIADDINFVQAWEQVQSMRLKEEEFCFATLDDYINFYIMLQEDCMTDQLALSQNV